MASLLDIAPLAEKVSVGGVAVEVGGVGADGITMLLHRFPDLRKLVTGMHVDADQLLAVGGEAVAAIIAAGTGHPGEPDHEAAARRLPAEAQAEFLGTIMRVTFPNGIGPFVEKLTGMLDSVGAGASVKAPASNSRKS